MTVLILAPPRPAAAGAGRTWLGAVGVVSVTAGLGWLVGPVGLLVGVVVAGLWYVLPGAYVVAVGHLLLLALGSIPMASSALVVMEAGFLAILAAPLVAAEDWGRPLAATAAAGLALALLAWFGWSVWTPRWLAVAAIVGVVSVALYGLHRYQLVRAELRGVGG